MVMVMVWRERAVVRKRRSGGGRSEQHRTADAMLVMELLLSVMHRVRMVGTPEFGFVSACSMMSHDKSGLVL